MDLDRAPSWTEGDVVHGLPPLDPGPPTGAEAALAVDDAWWPRPRPRPARDRPRPDRRGFRHTVGTRPVEPAAWLAPRPGDHVLLAWKNQLLDAAAPVAVAALPGSEAAAREVLELVTAATPGAAPDPVHDEEAACAASPLEAAARRVVEDLCVLDVRSAQPVLVAAVVAMPARWRPPDKLGLPLVAVHDPVPGYAPDVGQATDRLLRRLPPDRAVARTNWGVVDSPVLFEPEPPPPGPALTPADVPHRLWVRVEHQTLRALPRSGAVLFTIRTALERLGPAVEGRPERAAALRSLVEELPPPLLAYKGMAPFAEPLLTWLTGAGAQGSGGLP